MGVSLTDLVESQSVTFDDLKGKSIAIDAYNTLYQFLSIIRDRETGEPLRDSKGRITSHLSGLFYRTARMLEAGIRPVFVFDGKPPEFKHETSQERRKIREEAEAKWKAALAAGDTEAVRTYSQAAVKLTDEMIGQSKELLGCMGVPCVQAPSEGEAQAAYMAAKGMVWASGSQDWDSLLFGAPRLVRNLTVTGRRKVPRKEQYIEVTPELVELDKVLRSLKLSREQLVMLGILVGTDYNPGGVKGYGPKKAYKLVSEMGTFNAVFGSVEWGHKASAQDIFDFFMHAPVEDIRIETTKLNVQRLERFLVDEYGFSMERIENTLRKMDKAGVRMGQTGLSAFGRK
ncbi:MAG: flap endonuclease-1 [Candidatus Aenigmarchaeota archaeon]|nr:flap endonuclease-1 [Candidatus Aenigmarchaeota archaeon]